MYIIFQGLLHTSHLEIYKNEKGLFSVKDFLFREETIDWGNFLYGFSETHLWTEYIKILVKIFHSLKKARSSSSTIIQTFTK